MILSAGVDRNLAQNPCIWTSLTFRPCGVGQVGINGQVYASAYMLVDPSTGNCWWLVTICASSEFPVGQVAYLSNISDPTVSNCLDTGPWTLQKYTGAAGQRTDWDGEGCPFGSGLEDWGTWCVGSMPDTLSLTMN